MCRYWLETYGCQMNKAESGALALELRELGWQPADAIEQAELVILNTCSVRATAEDRIWGRLGFYRAEKKRAAGRGRTFRLVLMGCMAERLKGEILEQAPHVDLLVGTFQKHRLRDALEEDFQVPAGGPSRPSLTALDSYHFAARHTDAGFRALVPIMHGCDNFCSYCIVPHVRGPEVSRSPDGILAEIAGLEGAREITLLGQNVNSYRHGELDFPGLLRRALSALRPAVWLRFLTSHPKDFSPRLIGLLAERSALCRHVHLPVQHGADAVLTRMGRGYTRAGYLALAGRIRKEVPEVVLTTDILIGFPGETEEDFRVTLELMEQVQFDDAFTYRYNPRRGTKAFELPDDVPDRVKQARLAEVIRLQRQITRGRRLARVGREVPVLVEAVSRKDAGELLARTEGDETVVFPGPSQRVGRFTRVRLLHLAGSTFRGEEIPG